MKEIVESPLIIDFMTIWEQIKGKYQAEISALAYRTSPDAESVAKSFIQLKNRLR